jgi:hypothetical protein
MGLKMAVIERGKAPFPVYFPRTGEWDENAIDLGAIVDASSDRAK